MDPEDNQKEISNTQTHETGIAEQQNSNEQTKIEGDNQKIAQKEKVQETNNESETPITATEDKGENKAEKVIVQQKIMKQSVQQLKLPESLGVGLQRPISINIGKDSMQIEKNNPTLKEPEIKIEIKESFQKGFALNKQVFYQITGFDRHGAINIQRSQTEFESLRKILLQRWPGCFIPNISTKSDTRNQTLRNVHRRKNLQNFLIKVSDSEEVYYKQQMQLFLRCYGINIQEMFNQMPVLKVKDVIERFKTCFAQHTEKSLTPEEASTIIRFSTSLKKIANNLNNLSKRSLKLAQSYEVYQETIPRFQKFLNNYEQICLSQYTNNPNSSIVLKDSQGKTAKLTALSEKKNIFYDLYFLLECQQRDAEALSDTILALQMFNLRRQQIEYESKQVRMEIEQISLGQNNFKVITTRKPKQVVLVELEERQKFLLSQKHTIVQLYQIAQVVLANFTIPMFKTMKINNYLSIIKNWIEIIGDTNAQIYEVWKFLSEEGKENLKKSKAN